MEGICKKQWEEAWLLDAVWCSFFFGTKHKYNISEVPRYVGLPVLRSKQAVVVSNLARLAFCRYSTELWRGPKVQMPLIARRVAAAMVDSRSGRRLIT